MRIVHVASPWITVPPKGYGGTEANIFTLAAEQARLGHDVLVFAPDGSYGAPGVKIQVVGLPLVPTIDWEHHLAAYPHYAKIFRELLLQMQTGEMWTVVHIHLSSASDLFAVGFASLLKALVPNVLVIGTLHGEFPFDRKVWGFTDKLFEKEIEEIPLIAISKAAQRKALSMHPKLWFAGVVHHGLPSEAFLAQPSEPRGYLIWIGRITPDKGPHLAIRAATEAKTRLIIAGVVQNNPIDIQYMDEIVAPLLQNNPFVTREKEVDARQRVELERFADAFLNPIEWDEPFGLAPAEALALGVPVISFARGAIPEFVKDGINGFLVKNQAEMVSAIKNIADIDRGVVLQNARQTFSAERMAKRYLAIYKKLLSKSKS